MNCEMIAFLSHVSLSSSIIYLFIDNIICQL